MVLHQSHHRSLSGEKKMARWHTLSSSSSERWHGRRSERGDTDLSAETTFAPKWMGKRYTPLPVLTIKVAVKKLLQVGRAWKNYGKAKEVNQEPATATKSSDVRTIIDARGLAMM